MGIGTRSLEPRQQCTTGGSPVGGVRAPRPTAQSESEQYFQNRTLEIQFILAELDFGERQTYRKEQNAEPLPLESVGAEVRDPSRDSVVAAGPACREAMWVQAQPASGGSPQYFQNWT